MQKRLVVAFLSILLAISTVAWIYTPATLAVPIVMTDTYVSDTNNLWWSGANQANIDGSGYIVPPSDAVWSSAVFCWEHSSWNTLLNPPDLKAKLFASPSADWIWKSWQVTTGESYTGGIVFFKKQIDIPSNAFNIKADLFIITADNAYYFYVNKDWSGIPDGIASFAAGYNPTSFYYISDGVNNLGGGTNSVPYETVGNLYPKELAIPSAVEYWSSIEAWDISGLLHTGENWLQIVAINEHAPPQEPENNPAGLIYKVEVTYEIPPKHYLTVKTAPPGLVTIPGEGWYDECTYVDLDAPQYVYVTADTRYRFDHWDVDTVTVPGNPITVHMDANHTVTAHYAKQHYLTVTDDIGGISGVSAQSGWYDECTTVSLTAPTPVPVSPGVRYRFDHWDVDTVVVLGNPINVHMDAPHTATAHYVKQYYLTVKTDPDGLNPAPSGEGWYDECTQVSLIAPPVSYLGSAEYVFTYWDIDGLSTSDDIAHVHMDAPHTATAHYMPSCPRHLDAEPPRLINLTQPVSTEWHELYPEYCRNYYIQSWHDTNHNGKLDPSDYIDLWDMDHQWKLKPYFWHIDDVTVTLKVTKTSTGEAMYIEFEGGWAEYDRVIVLPECTLWHEVYPNYSRQFHLEKWFDNCDSKLSYCDRIILHDLQTSERDEYHVEAVKTDLIISPRTTTKTICKSKDVVAQGYNQIFCEVIHNYYANPTNFTIAVYYDGLQPIGNQTITLNPLDSGDAIITWAETATWPKGTYSFNITINNYVNNTLLYSVTFPMTFKISILGDVNGDGIVDVQDVARATAAFGTHLCWPRWNPSVDINGDGRIDVMDIARVVANFGKYDP